MKCQTRQLQQRGAAVVMALLIVVLCTLSVSPLIWNLFATAKTISVAAARDQSMAVSRSAVDWARVILREDARVSSTDTLTEPWAVPLAESRINTQDRQAVLTGRIEDAQGRFNLRNLAADNEKQAVWLVAFEKLCGLLSVSKQQRLLIVQTIGNMHAQQNAQAGTETKTSTMTSTINQPIAAKRWEEFQNQYGVSEETWDRLRAFVVILPTITPINANTASAEVLYAGIEDSSFGRAQRLVSQRDLASFRNIADIQNALGDKMTVNNDLMAVNSSFFLVEGTAQVEEALVRTHALLQRRDTRVYVIWRQ